MGHSPHCGCQGRTVRHGPTDTLLPIISLTTKHRRSVHRVYSIRDWNHKMSVAPPGTSVSSVALLSRRPFAAVRGRLGYLTVLFVFVLALFAVLLQTAPRLRSDTHTLANLHVLDVFSYTSRFAYDLVSDDNGIVSRPKAAA